MTTPATPIPSRCICGGKIEPHVYKSRLGRDVIYVCNNQWSDVPHAAK